MTDAIALRALNPTIFMFGLMRAILSFIDTKNTVPPVSLLLSILLSMAISPGAGAREAQAQEQTLTSREEVVDEPKQETKQKPWLITPTLSADPKLGANIGGLIAYVKKLDADSTPSMTGLSVSYSDTDSLTGALFSQLYWKADTRRLSLLAAGAEINNEYDDFLGTGQTGAFLAEADFCSDGNPHQVHPRANQRGGCHHHDAGVNRCAVLDEPYGHANQEQASGDQ